MLAELHRLLREAEQALAAGEPQRAARHLEQAGSLLEQAAPPFGYAGYRYSLLAARLALAEGQAAVAVEHARRAVSLAVPEDALDARLWLAQALEADGQLLEAARTLVAAAQGSAVLYRGALRDELLQRLGRLSERLGDQTPEERAVLFAYGRLLNRYGAFSQAVQLFSGHGWQELELQAAAELARALGATRQPDLRLRTLQAALEQAAAAGVPASRLSDLRLQLAEAYRHAGRWEQAVHLLQAVVQDDSGSEAAGQALLSLVRWQLQPPDAASAGGTDWPPAAANPLAALEEALRLLDRYAATAGRTAGWQEAAWILFTRALARPEGAGLARRALESLLSADPGDPAALYWAARLQETGPGSDQGRSQARPELSSPPVELVGRLHRVAPLSYHALLARDRWPPLAPPLVAPEAPAAGEEAMSEALDPIMDPIIQLHQQGYVDEAIGELRHRLKTRPSPSALRLLARWELNAGRHREAMGRFSTLLARERRASASTLPAGPAGGGAAPSGGVAPSLTGLPRELLEGLFPRPYRDRVEAVAAAWGLDPFLLYAVMREESSFEAGAYSPAGARGLMQLMPPTATWIAQQAGRQPPTPEALFEAELNLQLGAAYLRYLLDRYGDRRLAVAAYHAGPGQLDGWLAALTPPARRRDASHPSGTLPQQTGAQMALPEDGAREELPQDGAQRSPEWFVEQIPSPATRRYVYKVESSWRIYRLLYEGR